MLALGWQIIQAHINHARDTVKNSRDDGYFFNKFFQNFSAQIGEKDAEAHIA